MTTVWVSIGDLSVEAFPSCVMRNAAKYRADRIAAEFDPDLFDDLIIMVDDDGKYSVIDGKVRLAAMQKLYGKNERVPCRITKKPTD